jgi:hypothetical protein
VKNWQMPNNWENWSIKDLGRKKQSRGRSRSIPTKRDFNRASSLPPNPFNTPQPEQRKAELEAYIETRRPLVHRAEKLAKKYSALWRTPDFSTSEKRAEYMKNKLDPSKKKNFLALTKSEQSKGSRLPKAFGIAHRIVNR